MYCIIKINKYILKINKATKISKSYKSYQDF